VPAPEAFRLLLVSVMATLAARRLAVPASVSERDPSPIAA
jgi:hypothetical protein